MTTERNRSNGRPPRSKDGHLPGAKESPKGNRAQLSGLAIAIALVVAGKHYYRDASAEDLRWLLAPTAKMVSIVTNTHFVAEAGVGWIDRDVAFEIAPVCAGLNFALAAFLALTLGWFAGMRTWSGMMRRLGAAVAIAYAATLVVNTIRIAIAIRMHQHEMGGGELHRMEGIVVYLGGLCALYAAAQHVERSRHAVAR